MTAGDLPAPTTVEAVTAMGCVAPVGTGRIDPRRTARDTIVATVVTVRTAPAITGAPMNVMTVVVAVVIILALMMTLALMIAPAPRTTTAALVVVTVAAPVPAVPPVIPRRRSMRQLVVPSVPPGTKATHPSVPSSNSWIREILDSSLPNANLIIIPPCCVFH